MASEGSPSSVGATVDSSESTNLTEDGTAREAAVQETKEMDEKALEEDKREALKLRMEKARLTDKLNRLESRIKLRMLNANLKNEIDSLEEQKSSLEEQGNFLEEQRNLLEEQIRHRRDLLSIRIMEIEAMKRAYGK